MLCTGIGRSLAFAGLSIALHACSEPRFEFRGYSDLSGCQRIIDTELANGARFVGGFESDDVENPGYVAELAGELYGEPVDIEVLCTPAGRVGFVHYYSDESEPAETGRLWTLFADALFAEFGEPTMLSTDVNRSLRFLCHNPSPILLDEWRLVDEDREDDPDYEPDHEIYVAVVPSAAECLDERD